MQQIISPLHPKCYESTDPPPPFRPIESRFLQSSYAPSDEEVRSMTDLLKEEESGTLWYDEKILGARELLRSLEGGKEALENNAQQRRSAISTQRRIPAELWEIIFDMVCKTSNDGYSLVIEYDPSNARALSMLPITLSHVCSRWRYIALGCPKLWSTIYLVFHETPRCTFDVLHAFLHNSKEYPLELCIYADDSDVDIADQRCLDILVEHFCRCSKLDLQLWEPDTILEKASPSSLSFSNLVVFEAKAGIDSVNWFLQAILHAPKLEMVQIYSLCSTLGSSLPYPQLTRLRIQWLCPELIQDLLGVLRVSTNLRHLIIGLDSEGLKGNLVFLPRATISTARLPFLQSFIIDSSESDCGAPAIGDPLLRCLFESLEMPSLKTFQLSCDLDHGSGVLWPPTLLALISRSSSFLTRVSLSLALHGTHWPRLSVLLQQIPSIIHFDLEIIFPWTGAELVPYTDEEFDSFLNVMDEYISSLLFDLTSTDSLVPNLSTLSFQSNFYIPFQALGIIDRVVDLATARSIIRPLKSLRFIGFELLNDVPHGLGPSSEQMEALEALKGGVFIEVGNANRLLPTLFPEEIVFWSSS